MDQVPATATNGEREPETLSSFIFDETIGHEKEGVNVQPRHGKFRFKSSKSKSKRDASGSSTPKEDETHSHRRHRHRHHHGRHRSSKRQRTEASPPASPGHGTRSLSPNTAFRESLFDALGDDEGAAFWESVYGQPIHNYAPPKGPHGELERMTEEEYATYVRARMWERSHEGMMEERERLRQEKARQKQRTHSQRQKDEERHQFDQAMEDSLHRGQERRRTRAWRSVWEEYHKSWEKLNAASKQPSDEFILRNHIFWPVESGKRRDIRREAVEDFMRHGPSPSGAGYEDLTTILKGERVRWHPDKMIHRYGSLGLSSDKSLVQSVTEVFQILDHLWTDERAKNSRH